MVPPRADLKNLRSRKSSEPYTSRTSIQEPETLRIHEHSRGLATYTRPYRASNTSERDEQPGIRREFESSVALRARRASLARVPACAAAPPPARGPATKSKKATDAGVKRRRRAAARCVGPRRQTVAACARVCASTRELSAAPGLRATGAKKGRSSRSPRPLCRNLLPH